MSGSNLRQWRRMAAEYLRKLKALMDEVAPEESVEIRLDCKHFFSGAALYANGKICVTLTPVGLALKLPEGSRALLEQTGATQLRYSPEGPVKKDYVVLPKNILDDISALRGWVRESIEYAVA